MRPILLPPKYLLLLAVLISCADLLHYALLIGTAPAGGQFVGLTTDEAITFGLINSPDTMYLNPWNVERDENVFTTLSLTSPYTYVPLGLVANLFGMSAFWINIAAKTLLNVVLFIVAYNFMACFTKTRDVAFLLFMLASGISGIIYFAAQPFGSGVLHMIGNVFAYYEFEKVTLLYYQLYYNLPKITGMLAVIFYSKNRKILSGLMLGLTGLFYPAYIVGFGAALAIYAFINERVKKVAVSMLIGAVFMVPWLYARVINPGPFALYAAEYFSSAWLAGMLIAFSTLLAAAAPYWRSKIGLLKNRLFVLFLGLFAVVFSLYQLRQQGIGSPLVSSWLVSMNLYETAGALNGMSLVLQIISAAVFAWLALAAYRSNLPKSEKFFSIWFLFLAAASLVHPDYSPFLYPARFLFLMRLPLAILAAAGVVYLAAKYRVDARKIIAIIIIISLPSLVAAEIRYDRLGREENSFYAVSDVEALEALQKEPFGTVLSSPKIGAFGPSISDKKFVEFPWPTPIVVSDYEQKVFDYREFFSTFDRQVLDKYGVDYVFYGQEEQAIGGVNPDGLPFLEKIYDGESDVYRVIKP